LNSAAAPFSNRNETARALLAKHFPKSFDSSLPASPSAAPKTTDPAKLAQIRKVELMKMRQRAKPLDPKDQGVAPSERIHLKVRVDETEKVFWSRKVCFILSYLLVIWKHFISLDNINWKNAGPTFITTEERKSGL
jgi:hypothetical protein